MKREMTWADLNILSSLNRALSEFGVYVFLLFSLLSFLRYVFLKVAYINIILNYIITYKNGIIIASCIILTLFTLFPFKTKFNFIATITTFISFFGLLSLLMQLFFSI